MSSTPSIASRDQLVAVAWGASLRSGATDVYLAVSRDGGRVFGPAVRVNDVVGDAKLGGEQPPHVALVPRAGRDPKIVVVWTAKGTTGTRVMTASSDNAGTMFTRATAVSGGEAAGNRGWESTAVDRNGNVVTMWLDHRETAPASGSAAPMNHEGMHHDGMTHQSGTAAVADSVARAQLSKLYFGRAGASEPARALVGGVCYCCKTTVDVGPDGAIYAAWRHVYPGNVRDIAFTVSRDGGQNFSAPLRVSSDNWVLDGCPENGPTLAVDSQSQVHIVWPTLVNGAKPGDEPSLALFYAESAAGKPFTARQRISTEGAPRHPQIAVTPNNVPVVVWDEGASGSRQVVMGRNVGRAGSSVRTVVSAPNSPATYPVVTIVGSSAVVAWTDGTAESSVIRVKRIDLAEPAPGVARK